MSPQHIPYEDQKRPFANSSPVAVRAAVHRADTTTGTITTTSVTRTTAVRTPSSHKSEGSLDHSNQNDKETCLEYRSETCLPKRQLWQRSASCRELYDFSFEDSGKAKHKPKQQKKVEKTIINLEDRRLESPITRYDDHRAIYAVTHDNSLEIHQDIMMPDQKVYSSSYPGTTIYSQESVEDPGNYDLRDSQDDLSHDSYELIERSDDDYSTSGDYKYRKGNALNARSCSLDSGNYLPSDTDSELEKRHKCKSSSDVHHDIFTLEDPRDFPREIIPRKSDGSFYKAIKSFSRTSSLESKHDYYEGKGKVRKKGSFGSRTSSQESKSDYETKRRPMFLTSRSCSAESKSEYSDALSKTPEFPQYHHDYDRKIHFERNYGTQKPKYDSVVPEMNLKETSHVHSISLQNVETEQSIRAKYASLEQSTLPRTSHKSEPYSRASAAGVSDMKQAVTHIWPEKITGMSTEIVDWSAKQRSTESESNIFSFDEDRIQSLQESDAEVAVSSDTSFGVVPNIDKTSKKVENGFRNVYRDIFMEIEPSRLEKGRDPLLLHQPIERTKSDPNSLARQRINSNRRMFLMHQKSIDLTPAESSDEDYLYKQIPSAPPITKYKGTHFEMPTAEFGHFDILKREIEGQKTKFEVPKRQFEILGAKTQFDLINLPPKNEADIPYVLHKRHIINGTEDVKSGNERDQRFTVEQIKQKPLDDAISIKQKNKPKSPVEATSSSFLFTQNIDLSKIDPVTLEIDKTAVTVQHISSPKRDITRIDPVLLETLSSKLSQIESDSPTSSKTESLKPSQRSVIQTKPEEQLKLEISKVKVDHSIQKNEPERKPVEIKPKVITKEKIKTETKPKRVIKPRMQPGKKAAKSTKAKVRITSFSSDDESLDSDDVFGSAEATPTKLEFSPPQMRKEMESILKFESERKYLQYTMSSTEVEGSPPQTRKKKEAQQEQNLELTQTELRRISERSFSLPSSEDDLNIKTCDLQPVFTEPLSELLPETVEDGDKSVTETRSDQITVEEVLKEKNKDLDEEMEREKQLLKSEIEEDLKNLNVPPKTKITEITSPSVNRKSQSPLLHARLNLSEGSAFTLLQKQQALESPISGRRTKSLDAPVIPVNKLPPLNAFSSKDDTVEEEDHTAEETETAVESEGVQEVDKLTFPVETLHDMNLKPPIPEKPQKVTEKSKKPCSKTKERQKSGEKDQIVPEVIEKPTKKSVRPTLQTRTPQKVTSTKASASRFVSQKEKPAKSQKPPLEKSITPPQRSLSRMEKIPQKTASLEKPSERPRKSLPEQTSLPTQASLQLPEIKRAKSQEIESNRKSIPKEKTRSLDKIEFKRMSSKERTRSQEESDTDIAKRKEKQQMLYETAVKQTLKSPVKDVLPVFPQVEEMVRERHGKLEISINTIENTTVPLEEAIIITKSPKKLDKKIDKKLTKSLELDLTEGEENQEEKAVHRLGKSLDLDNRPKEQEKIEFDFQLDAIKAIQSEKQQEEVSPESDDPVIQKTVEAQVHKVLEETEQTECKQDTDSDKIILEGTSLDVWLSLSDKSKTVSSKLENIKVIQKSDDFFDRSPASKPPDLGKSSKSSSDSQSLEKVSLGNSLDIKYIDDSGDSSHKSEKDAQLIKEMQKASETVGRLLKRKLEKRKKIESIPSTTGEEIEKNLMRITSEDESLTEVSDLKCEVNSNFLAVDGHKDALLKLSIERSKSEDTGSWITVECDEYVGTEESFETDNAPLDSPEKDSPAEIPEITKTLSEDHTIENSNLLTTDISHRKIELLKRSSDQSKSSDTGSWTSGEKDISPSNINEKGTGDESSVSCSMGRTFGLSQTIEKFASKDQIDKGSPEMETPKSPRSPRSPRICVLGRAFTIDEESGFRQRTKSDESSSEGSNEIPKDLTPIQETEKELYKEDEANGLKYKKNKYPFEEKWSGESELGQRLQQKIVKKLSSAEKNSVSSIDDSYSERKGDTKRSIHSFEKLSTESRNSIDTESSSGSLGVAVRMQKSGDIPKELSSTWKPFPLDSSGSSSFEEGLLPPDRDLDQQQEYFLCKESSVEFGEVCHKGDDSDATPTKDGTQLPDDLANFSTTFNYPSITSNIGGIGLSITAADMLTGYCTTFLSRTLSRISERSTNSEKSSLDEDSTKISTQSDSLNDESLVSSDRQASLSSDSPSNARVSESDKKTSTNEKSSRKILNEKQSSEAIPNINNLLQRQVSDDRRTSAEMAELSMDDIEIITSERGLKLKRQGSDDTVIDEECFEGDSGRKESSSQSEEWPLPEIPNKGDKKPLMALHEAASTDTSQQTTQVFQPPCSNIPKTFGLRGSIKSQDSEQWPSPPSSVKEPAVTGNIETYYITPPQEAYKVTVDSSTVSTYDNDSNSDKTELDGDKSHTYENVPIEPISESISESLSLATSGVKIVLEKKSDSPHSCYSDEDLNLNDDVFVDTVDVIRNELRPPTALRKSDDSSQLKPPSPKGSHSSHSEEECSSSLGTNIEDGTVRYALKPTKCTHSSHSEDTSIALSLSEWSNSANTVKFQNLSSNSGTKSSSGLKSDDNSLTDIAQSISEWSTSNSNTLKAQQSTNLQFQKLSSTTSTGDSSTLTEFLPTMSDWSSSETSKTLVAQQFFPSALPERTSVSRLGSSIDDTDQLPLKSPQNIPSEDFSVLAGMSSRLDTRQFTKSTERPVIIHQKQSDSESDQKTVHIQRYDKDKQKYSQKHQISSSKSTERQVKVPLKLSKCSSYYSSSLSSESTPQASTSPIPLSKTATVPLTRSHRKVVSRTVLQAKSPTSENDSTSSMESPKSKSDRDRRGYRRRRQTQSQKRYKTEKHEEDVVVTEYNEYIRNRGNEQVFQYENILSGHYCEASEEGYFPDGDSQSGSDIFRMEREEDKCDLAEGFDVSSIPPPLLDDDFDIDRPPHI